LVKFGESFGVTNVQKDVWPYTYYKDVSDVVSATVFPPISVFCNTTHADKVDEFDCITMSLFFDGLVRNFGDCLDYFGMSRDGFTDEELSSADTIDIEVLDSPDTPEKRKRVEECLPISPRVCVESFRCMSLNYFFRNTMMQRSCLSKKSELVNGCL